MRDTSRRIIAGAIAVGVVVALSVPAIAGALPGMRESAEGSATRGPSLRSQTVHSRRAAAEAKRAAARAKRAAARAKRQAQETENLRNRIENKLRARGARFEAASANISKRIARVAALADKVEAAGGDVSAARAKLDEARAKLASALALEVQVVDELNAVPGAADRRSAFGQAKATGHVAVAELKAARSALREAAHLLRDEIRELREQAESADGTSATQ